MSKAQNNSDLLPYREVAATVGVTQQQVRGVIESLFLKAAREVEIEGRFELLGVGVFLVRTRKARTIRNPITKALMRLPSTRTVGFRPAKRGVFAGGGR